MQLFMLNVKCVGVNDPLGLEILAALYRKRFVVQVVVVTALCMITSSSSYCSVCNDW